MRFFRIAVYGRPAGVQPGGTVSLDGVDVATLQLTTPPNPLPVTFEEAEAALTRLPRLYFEPDGSFGWFSAPDEARWDLGGMLYDRGDRVMVAELNGTCTADGFRELFGALGGEHPTSSLVVHLLSPTAFLDPGEFSRML